MSDDVFKQGFQEEARELLSELETALLELDQSPDDLEVVARAFRVLHTIKGSGAMFGFDAVAAFAHDLESVFDRLRKGHLRATHDLINLTLAAADQIEAMLDEAKGVGVSDRERSESILGDLRVLTGQPETNAAPPPAARTAAPVPSVDPATEWNIHFRPGPDVLLKGTNPLLLLRELGELGQLQAKIDDSALPPIVQMDPERCYLAWDMVLTTGAGLEAIRDVFIFVEDESDVRIEASGASTQLPALLKTTPAATRTEATMQRSAGESSIRVPAEKLDQLVNLVGELVTVQARLSAIAARQADPEILAISEDVDRLTFDLRENSMSIRMVPLRNTFERFRRLVHDLAGELHKSVDLVVEGADTELDKTVIEQLKDPLVHLIRNSMDHGIEPPEARVAAGKPPTGSIRLSALHSGAQVYLRVSDDGRGLDAEAVRARAVEQGLIEPSARLSESELFSLILEPGFSTAHTVTEVSGRGVGMDVVRRGVESLRGSIDIASKPGAGMTVTLRLPLTLAIIDGLLVRVGSAHFVLPLASSLECLELTREDIRAAHGNHLASVRGETIPYIRLSEFFGMSVAQPEREQIMVVETEDGRYGLVVDEVLGNHQTVIKNLGRLYRDLQTVSGATILGNGTVALILDPHRLVQSAVQEAFRNKRPDGCSGRGNSMQPNRMTQRTSTVS